MPRLLYPFKNIVDQKVISIIIAFIGLFIFLTSIPFIIAYGSYGIIGFVAGLIVELIALLYFLYTVN